jgi:hypothetical protein
MKREVRHYIPHIDEFHVGFEYEVIQKAEKYDPNILTTFPVNAEEQIFKYTFPDPYIGFNTEKLLKNCNVRVKFLDADDIISLGFQFAGETKDYQLFTMLTNLGQGPNLIELSLNYYGDFPVVTMSDDKEILVDRIICLNKSELKWLLTRFKIA